ncbi:hypothetical protein AB205_0114040 [Aquarana catesbeiana]|uniref:Uncharacterized protein n=1 Tax=Aquarana catesbeiana TaxID=8400 RepID=A0A2G9RJN2_AQUCT|nr:hypothetical protein AB205_0114040 [Aquarana catesbeiana]
MRMDKNQSHVTERILNLTLEIIYLLTGEEISVVKTKSGEPLIPRSSVQQTSPITVPPPHCHCLTTKLNIRKKILEATKKPDLLTGEVPIRCQDVTVYFSMEEWEYLEGHKVLYKDVMIEDQPPLTSPDVSSNGNPPERCPRPLYSRDSTQEGHTIPHHHQGVKLGDLKVEDEEEKEETLNEDLIYTKVEIEEEEDIDMSANQQSTDQDGEILKSEQENFSPEIGTDGRCLGSTLEEDLLFLTSDGKAEDNGKVQYSPAVNPIAQNIHHSKKTMDPSNPQESFDQSHTITPDLHRRSHGPERSTDPPQPKESSSGHEGVHTAEHSLLCLGCGKSFKTNSELRLHLRSHTRVTFTCSECGKSYTEKKELLTHQKIHKAESSYSCSECGKRFAKKAALKRHQKIHTSERSHSCSECGKRFSEKRTLLTHQRIHTGERPFSCPDCGKSFIQKTELNRHVKGHKEERRYTCSECGKYFHEKVNLLYHQNIHAPVQGAGSI